MVQTKRSNDSPRAYLPPQLLEGNDDLPTLPKVIKQTFLPPPSKGAADSNYGYQSVAIGVLGSELTRLRIENQAL